MVTEASDPSDEDVIDVSDVLEQIRQREEAGIYPKMPTIEERARAQGKEHLLTQGLVDHPVADFEFDVDEFLRIIYEGRSG